MSKNKSHTSTEQSSSSGIPQSVSCEIDFSGTVESLFSVTESITISKPRKIENQRIYDKKQSCLFCKKLFSKLPQHLMIAHANKKEVSEFMSLPKGGKLRADKIRQLRNKGNFLHNTDVLNKKEGPLIVARRSSNDVTYTNYLPCEYCHAFFHKRKLWRHAKNCPDKFEKRMMGRRNAISNGFLLTPLDKSATQLFHNTILKDMHEGEEKLTIRQDQTLCMFGSREAAKHKNLPQQKNHISFKLRLLARLILHLKKAETPLTTIAQCVLAENFDVVSTAVVQISLDEEKPSLGQKLGHHLKKCAKIVRNRCIVEENDEVRKKVEGFLLLFEDEWEERVSKPARDMLDRRRYTKKVNLPSTEDIMRLNRHILMKEQTFIESNFADSSYTEVAKVTLAHIIVFNRRRAGEVSLMEVDSFKNRIKSTKPQGEIEELLSASETQMYTYLEIVYLRGKKGTKIDCLLTPNMVRCIEYLLETREASGILPDNIYIFCLPYSKHCIRGYEALRELACASGAKLPSELKSTKLRKHISTVSQLLNLSDSNFNSLCKHMGHNPKVHREYYQMPEEMILKTQISKILVALQQGSICKFKGKKLNEFEVSVKEHNDYKTNSNDIANMETHSNVRSDRSNDCSGVGTALAGPSKTNNALITDYSSDSSRSSGVSEKAKLRKSPYGSTKKATPQKARKKGPRTQWTTEEITILKEFFAEEIMLGVRPPTKKRCEECMRKFPLLQGRGNYLRIKWRVNSIIQENQKRKR